MAAAYTAGASHLPFGMLRGYIGTDLARKNPSIRSVTCPYTGEEIATVPALNPDVTILHAQKADRQGNVLLRGIVGARRKPPSRRRPSSSPSRKSWTTSRPR